MHGSWETQFGMYRRAVHLIHLRSGKFLYWADGSDSGQFGTEANLWDPANPLQNIPANAPSPFNFHCAGHSALPDGRIIVAGGEFAHVSPFLAPKHVGRFDSVSSPPAWAQRADMHERRWYPTCTTLPNGRIAAFAGWVSTGPVVDADIPEVYDPATDTWEQKTAAQRVQDLYPFMFVMPDGRLFDAGPQNDTRFLDLDTWQ